MLNITIAEKGEGDYIVIVFWIIYTIVAIGIVIFPKTYYKIPRWSKVRTELSSA